MMHRRRCEARPSGRTFPSHSKARDKELAALKKRLKQAELERDLLKKAIIFFSDAEVKHRFIASCASSLHVQAVCDYLGVAYSGYYQWLKHMSGQREQEDAQLGGIIETELYKHRKTYGIPRMRVDCEIWADAMAVVVFSG